MDILGKLFGSTVRVKLIRLFVLNSAVIFDLKEISRRLKISARILRREIRLLADIKLIQLRPLPVDLGRRGSKTLKGKKINGRKRLGWQLTVEFPFISHLESLLNAELLVRRGAFANRFKKCGAIKFVSVAGIFLPGDTKRTVDLLIVGDRLRRSAVENTIRGIEADIGRELDYAVFETRDFNYRLTACDKFVRDILDYPHERIIDKIKAV